MHTVNLSAAALFRKVSEGRCTLLLDEADTYLGTRVAKDHEDLRGLVNAGHRRGAVAYRCVIDKGVRVEEFPAFCPVALAGIGDLPDTILDRSVVVAMKRRAPGEHVEPFRHSPGIPWSADALRRGARPMGGTQRRRTWRTSSRKCPTASSTDRPTCGSRLIVIGDYAGAVMVRAPRGPPQWR